VIRTTMVRHPVSLSSEWESFSRDALLLAHSRPRGTAEELVGVGHRESIRGEQ
jgi:hypothetical protein